MPDIRVSQPFTVELDGEAHPPHSSAKLELCALLFGGDTPAPFAFTSTSDREHSEVRGVVTRDHDRGYALINIDVTKLTPVCTYMIIAVHVNELTRHQQHEGATRAINPTIKHFTYSVRALGFGHSATYMDEDSVYGAALFALYKEDDGWDIDERQPAVFPELVELAWTHGALDLTPWPV